MMLAKLKTFTQMLGYISLILLVIKGGLSTLDGNLAWALIANAQATEEEVSCKPEIAENPTVPQLINYQGTLTDKEGSPLNGYYTMTFRIYDRAEAAITECRWGEIHANASVRNGRFIVSLGDQGSPIPPSLFSNLDRFIGITVDPHEEMKPRQRFASVAYALNAADGVPVGAVIDWWRPNDTFLIPDGYQICDGSEVKDPDSPLKGEKLPDLNGAFIRGVTDENQIATTGGAINHNHSINHDHDAVQTSANGTHNHIWSRIEFGNTWHSYNSSAEDITISNWGNGLGAEGQGHFPLEPKDEIFNDSFFTTIEGQHIHDVDLSGISTTSGTSEHLPPYWGLLKLCRIR